MTLDDLIHTADPARSRAFSGGTATDAARLIDQLEADHPSAADRWRPARPEWLRRIGSLIAPAGALGATAFVVVIAVLYAHPAHTRRPAPASTSRPKAKGGAKVVALGTNAVVVRGLRAELGILRQSQTPAAKAFNASPKLGVRLARAVPYMPALTRAIELPHKVVLYLYVAQRREVRVPHLHGYRAPAGLGMVLRAPYQGFGDCCIQPRALRKPVGPQATPYTMSQKPAWLYFELVPDGVTSVRWTFPAGAIKARRDRTVTVRVRDNVAALTLPHAGGGNSGNIRSDAWYGPNGHLIARRSG